MEDRSHTGPALLRHLSTTTRQNEYSVADKIFLHARWSISLDSSANMIASCVKAETRGDAVCWCTAPPAGRSRVRFLMALAKFFIYIILPATLYLRGRLSLYQKWVPGIFLGGKGCLGVGLTTLTPSCADCHLIWEPQHPGTLRACIGVYKDCFTITYE